MNEADERLIGELAKRIRMAREQGPKPKTITVTQEQVERIQAYSEVGSFDFRADESGAYLEDVRLLVVAAGVEQGVLGY
jgi:hypothetical protein